MEGCDRGMNSATLITLKMEEEAMKQRNVSSSRGRKRQGDKFSQGMSFPGEKNQVLLTPSFFKPV